jgi:cation transport protein ChaC
LSEERQQIPIASPESRLGRALRREDFTAERARRLAEALLKRGAMPLMSEEARKASLARVLRAVPSGSDVWVFAYGSLMWNPAIRLKVSRRARIRGYHRSFCLTMSAGRGAVEQPGLMLGLDRGGSCAGIAHAIAAAEVKSELTVLWYREMLSGAYDPKWITAEVEDFGRLRTLAFVLNRTHPRFEGSLDEEIAATRIAAAEGFLGTNRDYLFQTVAHLEVLGLSDAPIERLVRRVRVLMDQEKKENAT